MTTNYHERNHWVGTAAEMALCVPVNPGAVWFVDSGIGAGDSYWWDGASWNAMGGGGGGGCFVCDVTNTYGGDGALVSHTTATNDTAVGYNALNAELGGGCNVAVGSEALEFNTSGDANIAVGYLALVNNTTGYANIAIGSPRPTWDATLGSLTTARGCIAIGSECLTLVTERDNIGIGLRALYQADNTYNNIGIGTDALWSLLHGVQESRQGANYALGSCALFDVTHGTDNIGIGEQFGMYWAEGNVFVGTRAGDDTGNSEVNTGIGYFALGCIGSSGFANVAVGVNSLCVDTDACNEIDEFSDYSGTVPGTVLAHNIDPWGFGLANGVYPDMRITGTDHYNGNYTITVIDSKHFYFTHAWNGDDVAIDYWSATLDYALEGNGNTAIGAYSGYLSNANSYCTYVGYEANSDGLGFYINSMALGANSEVTKSNQVVIGDDNIDETLLKGTVIINELGDASWDFRVESDTEVNQIFLDSSADKLYLGGNTNAVTIDKGGELTLIGTATVWEDLRVPVTSTKLGGTKDPHFTVFKTNGAGSQGVFLYWFDKTTEEELYFTCQVPHAYKEGTNLIAHIHWIPKTNGGANAVVSWGLEYTWANYTVVFANTSIIYTNTHLPADASLVADKHYMSSFAAINGAGKTISSMLVCRVFRDAGGTGLTDDYNDDAGMLEIDFHFENDTMGSKTETAK